MFGFTLYNKIAASKPTGLIAYPGKKNRRLGGHAVVALGFDDKKLIDIEGETGKTVGSIKIRN